MTHIKAQEINALRSRPAQLSTASAVRRAESVAGFGVPAIDRALPDSGLRYGLHEAAGAGPGVEHGAAAVLFDAAWPFTPALAAALAALGAGPHPSRCFRFHRQSA
jgi:hypothetical protein